MRIGLPAVKEGDDFLYGDGVVAGLLAAIDAGDRPVIEIKLGRLIADVAGLI